MKLHEKLSRTMVRTHIILENKVTLNKTRCNWASRRKLLLLLSPLPQFLVKTVLSHITTSVLLFRSCPETLHPMRQRLSGSEWINHWYSAFLRSLTCRQQWYEEQNSHAYSQAKTGIKMGVIQFSPLMAVQFIFKYRLTHEYNWHHYLIGGLNVQTC